MAKLMTIEDETVKEVNDLAVVVDNPEKHVTAMESYITFRVVTKVMLKLQCIRPCTDLFSTVAHMYENILHVFVIKMRNIQTGIIF